MQHDSKILITGSTGLIGRSLSNILKFNKFLNILSPTRKELDLCSNLDVEDYFSENSPEYVFHLAAKVGGIHANSKYAADFIYENTIMHTNVIKAAHKFKIKKLLFPGSACTYPKLAEQPIKEQSFLNGLIEPTNLAYAAAKINGIVMCQSFAKQYGMKVVIPMPTNTYGVGDHFNSSSSHVIPALINKIFTAKQNGDKSIEIWGTGTPLREFIYVDDLAESLLFLMQNYESEEIINIGTMQEISIYDLAKTIAKVLDYDVEIHTDNTKPDGALRKCLDSKKIFDMGWQPKINLEQGIELVLKKHFI